MLLGRGSYGKVFLSQGMAVKKFDKLPHLIQEYSAMYYFEPCLYTVHHKKVDFQRKELSMELYDTTFKKWLNDNTDSSRKGTLSYSQLMDILRDILCGLVELHDRGHTHGDLKPNNILICYEPFHAVLGDMGFVCVSKYSKVRRTAAGYRDPVPKGCPGHDMFSFGIILLELFGDLRMDKQPMYDGLQNLTIKKIASKKKQKLILSLLDKDHEKRPSSREVLTILFKQSIDVTSPKIHRIGNKISDKRKKEITSYMKESGRIFDINRLKHGFKVLILFLNTHKIMKNYYHLYTAVMLMILSAIFGASGFREEHVIKACDDKYNMDDLYQALDNILSDKNIINALMHP